MDAQSLFKRDRGRWDWIEILRLLGWLQKKQTFIFALLRVVCVRWQTVNVRSVFWQETQLIYYLCTLLSITCLASFTPVQFKKKKTTWIDWHFVPVHRISTGLHNLHLLNILNVISHGKSTFFPPISAISTVNPVSSHPIQLKSQLILFYHRKSHSKSPKAKFHLMVSVAALPPI